MNKVVSRRSFLSSTAALTAGLAVDFTLAPGAFAAGTAPGHAPIRVYVGTYTGSDGRGEGIYLFDFDPATGGLSNRSLAAATPSPTWIALHPSKRFLYAANELKNGAVTAFALDPAAGALLQLNTVSSHGASPCYLSFDASGKFALVANYMSGTIAVLPIQSDGSLGEATDVVQHTGSTGAPRATDSPAGSFSSTGHDAPHAHFIQSDQQGHFVLACDLGQDRIYTYRFDAAAGKLSIASTTSIAAGDGPRHLAFHGNGRWVYAITEQASIVILFDYDAKTGALRQRQTVSALPEGFAGTSYGSEILIHPNGKWLYAANRLHDTVAVFSIGTDGRLTRAGETSTFGDYPRLCSIDPSGRFFFVCDQRSDAITSFRIHPQTGLLAFTGSYTAVGTPACLIFA
jgi:6-phosphogluconolactonase